MVCLSAGESAAFFVLFFCVYWVIMKFVFSLSFFFFKKSSQGLAVHLPFQPSPQVVPAQGWHTPASDTRVIPLVTITLSRHCWCPLTPLCPLEGPVTPWAVVLDITSLSILFLGVEPLSGVSKVRCLQGSCEYSPSASPLPGGKMDWVREPWQTSWGKCYKRSQPLEKTLQLLLLLRVGRHGWKKCPLHSSSPQSQVQPCCSKPSLAITRFSVKDFACTEVLFLNEGYWSSFWP